MRDIFCSQFNFTSRLRITACSRRAVPHGETPKTSDFDSATVCERIGHMVDDGFDGSLNITPSKLRVFKTENLYQV